MPILLTRKDGSLTPFRNIEYLPFYYFIPQSFLACCGEELNSLPRNPQQLVMNRAACEIVESDLFLLLIIDAAAYMVWPHMGFSEYMEIYSGYDPAWKFAHNPDFWIRELIDERILPTADKLLKYCDSWCGYVPEADVNLYLSHAVPAAMEKYHMNEVIQVAQEHRCFEDFDFRNSNQKTDFTRKWYHTRTQHPQISLESFQEDYMLAHNGVQWDHEDESVHVESEVISETFVEDFLSTLTDKDRQILELRMQGYTLQEVADMLGYKNHSGVLKRIRKIGQAYEKYANEDLGFSESKIV